MPITLITAPPGTGKSVYLVRMMRDFLKETFSRETKGGITETVNRTLHVNGVRDLIIPHELIESPPPFTEWSEYDDQWSNMERKPGMPALDVPHCVDNWWLWVQPGDVLILDECQRFFRPASVGRKLPKFISALEIHRHYGVDFVVVTQHPNLIRSNVRDLVGKHYRLRRLPMPRACLLYEYDGCNSGGTKYAGALSVKVWKHRQEDYDAFKSSELHTKRKATIPLAMIQLAAALVALPWLAYQAWDVTYGPASKPQPPTPTKAAPEAAAGGGVGGQHGERTGERTGSGGGQRQQQQRQAVQQVSNDARIVDPRFVNVVPAVRWAPPEVIGCYRTTWDDCRCHIRRPSGVIRIIDDRVMCNAIIAGDVELQPDPPSEPRLLPSPGGRGVQHGEQRDNSSRADQVEQT